MLPATAEAAASFVAEAHAAPDDLTVIANIMPAPPMPFVPAEHHGRLVILALVCYAGPIEAGERVLAPFRRLGTPIADMVRPVPYPEIYLPEEEGYHPTAVGRTMFINSLDLPMAEAIVDTSAHPTPRCGSHSFGCSAERWPACPPRRSRGPTSRRSGPPRVSRGAGRAAGGGGQPGHRPLIEPRRR